MCVCVSVCVHHVSGAAYALVLVYCFVFAHLGGHFL